MNLVDRVLRDRYDELGLAERGLGNSWGTVLLTPRFVTSRHVVALVIPEGQRHPTLVVKVPRIPGDNGGILREADMLRYIAARTIGSGLGVPEVLGTFDLGSDTVLVETALAGVPLDPTYVTKEPGIALTAGVSFVDALPITCPAVDNRDWYHRSVIEPLEALASMADADSRILDLCDQTHDLLAPARSALLPAVMEHADLGHPNIFVAPGRGLQVVDWERASVDGVPGHDLIFFVQYLAESVAGAYTRPLQVDAFSDALGPKGWARDVVSDHLTRRGIDPDLLQPLTVVAWARSTATLAYRLDGGPASADPSQRRAVTDAVTSDRDFWLWRHAVEIAKKHT